MLQSDEHDRRAQPRRGRRGRRGAGSSSDSSSSRSSCVNGDEAALARIEAVVASDPGPHAVDGVQARIGPRRDARDDDQAGQAGIGAAAGAGGGGRGRLEIVPDNGCARDGGGHRGRSTNAEIEAARRRRSARRTGRRSPTNAAAEAVGRRRLAKALAAADRRASATDGRPAASRADADDRRDASRRRQDAGRPRRRPRRRGRPEGPPLPPRADDRQGGRDPRRHRSRGPPRDAGRDPAPARGLARLRRRVPGRPDEDASRAASARSPRGSGAVRDLDVLLEAADAYRADLPVDEQRALEPLLAGWRRPPRRRPPVLLVRELDSDGYRRWLDDYARVRPPRGPRRSRRSCPTRAAPRPRHRRSRIQTAYERSAPTSRSSAGPTSRRSTSCGSPASGSATRSSSSGEALGPEAATLIARVTALQDHLGL